MINDVALAAVGRSTCGPEGRWRRPLYDTHGFNRLPATLAYLLTGDESLLSRALPRDVLGEDFSRRWSTVVHVLVDGFGWHFFQRYADRIPFLKRLRDQGRVSPITTQFPSTTAAHMTTLHTGQSVGQSGVHEWFYYEPLADAVIAPLLYSLAGDHSRETLRQRGVTASDILPGPTIYEHLASRGVACTTFQDYSYAHSTYSSWMFQGARRSGYQTLTSGLSLVADSLRSGAGWRYFFFYIDLIDGRGHSHGIDSPEFDAAVVLVFDRLEECLYQQTAGQVKDTLFIMSADHGQVAVNETPPIYINVECPEVIPLLRTTKQGELIRFGGSPRDLFLYLKPDCVDEALSLLGNHLAGRAEVWRTHDMVEQGFFGPGPYDRLWPRLGDVVILPHEGRTVFWLEEGRFWMRHKGSHGGLTPQEMETIVGAMQL